MQLKRVEMQGFKSFADKTSIDFLDGITTIVGPNGSGKSNVSDAVRWVLGEQSAKNLRGSKMEDVIFSGTQQRKMLGLAEVTLVLDNSDGTLPVEYNEVSVTRRVYRSGESEYYINKSTCRLKDIQELFMDTGVGRDGYSIIGQGKIDEILSSKSEERRSIFEEASGIVKYRTRKDEAVRKLEHTTTNLSRVADVLAEIKSNLGPLEEKAKVAKRYLELRDELRRLEVRDFLNMVEAAEDELGKLNSSIEALDESLLAKQKEITEIELKKDENKLKLENILLDIEKSQEEYFSELNEIEKVKARIESFDEKMKLADENSIRFAEEIVEHKEMIDSLEQEITVRNSKKENMLSNKVRFEEELKEKEVELEEITRNMSEKDLEIENLKKYIEELKDKLTEYKVEISSLDATAETNSKRIDNILKEGNSDISSSDSIRSQEAEIKANLDNLRKEKTEIEEFFQELEAKKAKTDENISSYISKENEYKQRMLEIRSKINHLTNLENENEGYIKSVKSVMELSKQNGTFGKNVYGTVASLLDTKQQYEKAIEISLGGYLQNIVVDSDSTAKEAIKYLKVNSLGRATFLPLESIKVLKNNDGSYKKEEGYIGLANELVKYNSKFEKIVTLALGRTIIVDNIDSGVKLSKKISHGMKIVTLEGELIASTGSMTGGQGANKSVSLIGRNSKIQEYKDKLVSVEKEYNEFVESIEKDKQGYETLINQIAENRQNLSGKNIEFSVTEEKLKNIQKQLERVINTRKSREEEKQELFKQNEEIMARKLDIGESIATVNTEIEAKQAEIDEYARFNKEKENKVNFLNEDIVNLKISLSSFDESNVAIDEMIDKIKEDMQNFKLTIEKKEEAIRNANESRAEREKENEEDKGKLVVLEQNVNVLKEKSEILKNVKNENMAEQSKIEEVHIDLNKEVERVREAKAKVENKKVKFDLELDALRNKMWDEYELTISSAKEFEKTSTLEKNLSNTKIGSMIAKTKSSIKALGDVSVSAIEEFNELSKRQEFISKQKNDLEETKQKLENLIENTTSIMKTQFAKQFKIINENFGKVFVELFGGGKASLRLSDEKNILESGIEIEVQPPGKKLQNMMLLSGGERALTAIALLFSILKIKAPPFCILDEIEAALDDINVARFASYIKKYSKHAQFIVITHRKGTMEVATSVYGVTMQEYGISKLISMKMK